MMFVRWLNIKSPTQPYRQLVGQPQELCDDPCDDRLNEEEDDLELELELDENIDWPFFLYYTAETGFDPFRDGAK